ncbi:MAG: hypothetical protein CMJ83_14045, partial [Planctomycetes bacterium]|nr:hypothetical protein [Planctomycetota bacterium]
LPPYRRDMVECAGGRLTLRNDGSPNVAPFYIDRFEVTEADWGAFLAAHEEIEPPRHWGGDRTPPPEDRLLPIVWVDLHAARAYARWLGKRLPSRPEWEWAALGSRPFPYPWGALSPWLRANTLEASLGGRTTVGLFPSGVSPAGCFDMVGNVKEWTSSSVQPYSDQYFVKGGSFEDPLQVGSGRTILQTYELVPGEWLRVEVRPRTLLDWFMDEIGVPRRTRRMRYRTPVESRPIQERLATDGTRDGTLGFRCAMGLDAHDAAKARYKRAEELINRLGARDPVTWVFSTWSARRELLALGRAALEPLRLAHARIDDERFRSRVASVIEELGASASVQ